MNRQSDATCREPAGTRYAHCVDLTPPPEGFSDEVEEQIIRFLECRSGTFDLYGEIATGDAFSTALSNQRTLTPFMGGSPLRPKRPLSRR